MSDKCSLTWKTFPEHLQFVFSDLYHDLRHTDVSLVSDDQTQFKAHRIVLSACSPVFRRIIDSNPCQHPLIYLRGIQSHELESILQFMYLGEGRFYRERMEEFFKVARDLQVKDIVEMELSSGYSSVAVNSTGSINEEFSVQNCDDNSKPEFADNVTVEGKDKEEDSTRQNINQSTIPTSVRSSEIYDEINLQNIIEQYNVIEDEENHIDEMEEGQRTKDAEDLEKDNFVENEEQSDNSIKDKVLETREYKTLRSAPRIVADSTAEQHDINYPCDQCEYEATQKGHLKRHIEYKHDFVKVKYPCSECQYQSNSNSGLKRHRQNIHEGVKYPCNQCQYEATDRRNLQRHVEVRHTDIKYSCDQCDYQASTKGQVKLHIRKKHESKHEGVKYSCDQCGKHFSHASSLRTHILSVHGGQRFPCDQCGYQATQLANLKVHILKLHGGYDE